MIYGKFDADHVYVGEDKENNDDHSQVLITTMKMPPTRKQ